jgi:tetratricopeptide (TPR) repeat protein
MLRSRLLLALLVLAAAPQVSAQTAPRRTLVVPFENAAREARYQWLAEASAVLVADGLRDLGAPAFARTERVRAFEQLHLPPAASLSRATVIRVGQLVGAAEVIVGNFKVEDEQFSVTARSIQVDVGRVGPQVTERGPLTELFTIFERLSRRLSRHAGDATGSAPVHPPLDAFENFIKGLLAENPASRAGFLQSAIREYAGFDRARLALWEVRTDQGDHQSALETARSVPAASSLSRRARFATGVSLLELKRFDEAFETFRALLDESGAARSGGAVLNNLGVVQIRRGATPNVGTAAYYLTKAADAAADPDYLFNLGYAYVREGNYQGALYWLRESLRRDPTDADAHFVLAAALHATGNAVEAERERDLARQLSARYEELDGQAPTGRFPVPDGLERVAMDIDTPGAGQADQVLVSSAQREQRELATFHLDRGRRLFEREHDREAMVELRRAVYLSPYEAEAHLLIGRIHLRGGRPGDAVDALKISIWSEETVAARIALAEAYVKAGNSPAAKTEVERALVLDPESVEARRLLGTIKSPSP